MSAAGPRVRRGVRRAGALGAGVLTALLLGLGLSACDGATDTAHRTVSRGRLDVDVSLPLIGDSRVSGEAALAGVRAALAARHGRIGRYRIALHVLNDATRASGGWDPGATTADARAAAQDPRAMGYVGDLNSGATAVSIPVLNRAAVPQVSPLSTAVGLTHGGPEASPGEPQKYYPTTVRTFVRVVPSDVVQSAVQVALQRQAGCRRVYMIYDDQVDGRDSATSFAAAARAAGLPVIGFDQYDPTATTYLSLGRKLARLNPDCVLISALPQDHAAAATAAIARALPAAHLFATAALAEPAFVDPAHGGVPASVGDRLRITAPALAPLDYPPGGRRFLHGAAGRSGPGRLDGIFGEAAMALLLDAIDRASHGGTRDISRIRVRRALFATRDLPSVLGRYSITPGGDTTLRRFGVYRVVGGRMVFVAAMRG